METAQVVEADGVLEQTPFFAIAGNALDQFFRVRVELRLKSDKVEKKDWDLRILVPRRELRKVTPSSGCKLAYKFEKSGFRLNDKMSAYWPNFFLPKIFII